MIKYIKLTFILMATITNLYVVVVANASNPLSDIETGCPSLTEPNPHIYVWRIDYGGGVVEDVPFDQYIIGVVEGEIFPGAGDDPDGIVGFDSETLKAQAIIARSFAFSHCGGILVPSPNGNVPGITDSQQAYFPNREGVDYSFLNSFLQQNTYLARNDNPTFVVEAEFKAYTHDGTTHYTGSKPGSLNLRSVYDPVTENMPGDDPKRIALPGFGQNAGDHWSRGLSYGGYKFPKWDYTKILAHYYTNIQLRDYNGNLYWGPYRWNMLRFSPTEAIYYQGESKLITIHVQNTGTTQWEPNTELQVCWRRTYYTGAYNSCNWQTVNTIIPTLNPGEDALLPSFTIIPPLNFYVNSTDYTYQLLWDLKRPGGTRFASGGWLPQEWPIKFRKRVAAPLPTTPPCQQPPCAQNIGAVTIEWQAVNHDDPIVYIWQRVSQNGVLSGMTSNPAVSLQLDLGTNDVYVKTVDTTEPANESTQTLVFHGLYDPLPPALSADPLPMWTNQPQLTLQWSATDPPLGTLSGSGLRDFSLSQQIDSAPAIMLLNHESTTHYTTAPLSDGSRYTFQLSAYDYAGNSATITLPTQVDRSPPTSYMLAPTGALSTTWIVVRWTGADVGAGIGSYALDVQVNGGAWQPWRVVPGNTMAAIFQGDAMTTYGLRIRAVDRAGNDEALHANADIVFSTGTATAGLSTIALPLLRLDK